MSKKIDRRDVILEAALSIADRDGIEGLTLRKIESETGLSAPLVYRHFADKAEIVLALVERILARSPPVAASPDDARAWLEAAFLALYRNGRDHAALLALLASVDPLQANALRLTEQVLAALSSAGLDPPRAGQAFQILMAYTLGSLMLARGTQLTEEALTQAVLKHPPLLAAGPYLDSRDENVFVRGLSALLAHLLSAAPNR